MPRRKNLIRSIDLHVMVPEDLHAQLTLHLYSPLEGRVPDGAYKAWLCERIKEYFTNRQLDLAPWAVCDPGSAIVSAPPATLEILKRTLVGDLYEA